MPGSVQQNLYIHLDMNTDSPFAQFPHPYSAETQKENQHYVVRRCKHSTCYEITDCLTTMKLIVLISLYDKFAEDVQQ
jgi:hypothetical protein